MEYVIGGLVFICAFIGLVRYAAKSYVDSILDDPTCSIVPIPVKNENQPKVNRVKKNL